MCPGFNDPGDFRSGLCAEDTGFKRVSGLIRMKVDSDKSKTLRRHRFGTSTESFQNMLSIGARECPGGPLIVAINAKVAADGGDGPDRSDRALSRAASRRGGGAETLIWSPHAARRLA